MGIDLIDHDHYNVQVYKLIKLKNDQIVNDEVGVTILLGD